MVSFLEGALYILFFLSFNWLLTGQKLHRVRFVLREFSKSLVVPMLARV
jgi:hypothetical protein